MAEITIYGYDHTRKISLIRFIRALIILRDGPSNPLGLKEAKKAVDEHEATGRPICITGLPEGIGQLADTAAMSLGVDMTPPSGPYPLYL